MEVAKVNIALDEHDWVDVYALGDIHEGAANHDSSALARAVAEIAGNENPHTYVILMGDYADCIIQSDPRFNPVEIASHYKIETLKDLPRKQSDIVIRALEPVRDKVIATLAGNHEEQYIKRHSFDVYDYFSSHFPNAKKLGYVGMVRFSLESGNHRSCIDIAVNHGAGGGGMREGYHTNKLYDVFKKYRADYYLMGHLHGLLVRPSTVRMINATGTGTVTQRVWHCMTGCFLRSIMDGQRNYFEHKPGEESRIGMVKCSFRCSRQTVDGERRVVKTLRAEAIEYD